MDENKIYTELKGNVALIGFEELGKEEQEIVRKNVSNYIRKMNLLGDLKEMKLSLNQHKHGKSFKHEINARVVFSEGQFSSSFVDWNLYSALSNVCEKIISELQHHKNRK